MVTKKEQFKCSVCGKLISAQGVSGHERSKYHLDALAKQNAKQNGIQHVPSIEPEIVPEIKGIQTTVPEGQNDTNKDTREGQDEQHTEDSGEWDGYLC